MCRQRQSTTLCNIGYRSEIHLKLKSREISFTHNICRISPIVLKFNMIGLFKRVLWTSEISRDLGVRWVWDVYHRLHSTPEDSPPKLILNSNLEESRLPITYCPFQQSLFNFGSIFTRSFQTSCAFATEILRWLCGVIFCCNSLVPNCWSTTRWKSVADT